MYILVIGILLGSSFVYVDAESPPHVCGVNEHYETQSNSCQITCENMHLEPIMGACFPSGACYCNEGHVRDDGGTCIKRKNCFTKVCTGPNEVVTNCYTPCQRNCSNRILGDNRVCHTACIETGCVCAEDYLRHDNGTCVPVSQCSPPKCNANEVYTRCGSACPTTCENRNDTTRVCIALCVDGCFCAKGLIRGPNGTCIRPDQCPTPKCDGPNEKFEACPPNCPHQNCSAIWSRIDCTNASKECRPQCRCIDGYYRNDAGICISSQECIDGRNKECPPNSSWQEEASPCPLSCDQPYVGTCQGQVKPGCVCSLGYLRDKNNNCIRADACPTAICGKNQTYVGCLVSCPTDFCKESNNPDPQCLPPYPCNPGCRCKPDYRKSRNNNEECILATECPPVVICGEDEHFESCGTACPLTCKYPSPRACTKNCVRGCFCNSGLVRNEETGQCIAPKECPIKVCTGPNEVVTNCYTPCQRNCSNRIIGDNRVCHTACIDTGCVCAEDYLRHDNGTCVPVSQCSPPKCNANEVYTRCGSACPTTCENRNDTTRVCIALCVDGCFCAKGLIRGPNGTCIRPDQCPTPKCDRPNEKFEACPPNCPHQNCSAIWSRIDCTNASKECRPQCRCIDGYYRNDAGICISSQECIDGRNKECLPNSSWQEEASPCPLSCDQPFVGICQGQVKPGCVCSPGYLRDKNNNCIRADACPTAVCGKNQTYVRCSFSCPTDFCKDSNNPVPQCMPPYPCNPGCRCKPDYRKSRNNNDECILATDCPPVVICGEDEHFESCGTACPLTCKYPSPRACTRNCVRGCFCNSGLVRNEETGQCIAPKDCPIKVCTGPNEVVTNCYTPCQRNCSNRIIGDNRVCHTACIDTGCVCAEDYLRHDNGTCVPVSQCSPPKCHANEVYTRCGSACPTTCENRNDSTRVCIALCVDGCFCAKGLIRGPNGTCIRPDQCPTPKCDRPNEKFEACPPNCPHQNCSAIWSRIDCTNASKDCRPQCRCIDGYYRNNAGICISSQECIDGRNKECPPNSSWQEEASPCPLRCDQPFVGICHGQVKPGCVCSPGYLRDKNNNCIRADACPTAICGKNQTYVGCLVSCPTDFCKESNNPDPQCSPPHPCNPGCRCKPDYRKSRNNNDECILATDCPPVVICGKDEHFESCGTACPLTCKEPSPRACTRNCVRGCFCNSGLVRNEETGQCIAPKDCPIKCKANEVFSSCKISCPPQTCASIYSSYYCPENSTCEPGCNCINEYLRNGTADDPCIPSEQCPPPTPVCGANEKYYDCMPCRQTCQNKDQVIFCTAICKPGCACIDKYVRRNSDGVCVLPSECPKPVCGINEKYYNCKPCTKTCETKNRNIACKRICTSGCDCLNKYVRLIPNGPCVLPSQCPAPVCGINEKYYNCKPCTKTCENRNRNIACTAICAPGCDCLNNYVRLQPNGPCVLPSKCPRSSSCDKT